MARLVHAKKKRTRRKNGNRRTNAGRRIATKKRSGGVDKRLKEAIAKAKRPFQKDWLLYDSLPSIGISSLELA
jgi:hypothetical protein